MGFKSLLSTTFKRNKSNKSVLPRKIKPKLVATVKFDQKVANSYHDLRYYEAEQERYHTLAYRDIEKEILQTTNKDNVTFVFKASQKKAQDKESRIFIFKALTKIRDKSIKMAKKKKIVPFKDIFNLVYHPLLLLQAYRTVRGKKGALTEAYPLPASVFNMLSQKEKYKYVQLYKCPDGMSVELITYVSNQIKNGTYQWGCSRQIWMSKPGAAKGAKMRPITIPPFVDRMVQEAIRMVLEAVFEPTFVQMNCSFGFRASVGCAHKILFFPTTIRLIPECNDSEIKSLTKARM